MRVKLTEVFMVEADLPPQPKPLHWSKDVPYQTGVLPPLESVVGKFVTVDQGHPELQKLMSGQGRYDDLGKSIKGFPGRIVVTDRPVTGFGEVSLQVGPDGSLKKAAANFDSSG